MNLWSPSRSIEEIRTGGKGLFRETSEERQDDCGGIGEDLVAILREGLDIECGSGISLISLSSGNSLS